MLLVNQLAGFGAIAGGYRAEAVTFDGSNDYLELGSDYAGNADGKVGTISVWYKANGGDGTVRQILELDGVGGLQHHIAGAPNALIIDLYTSGVVNILRMASSAVAAGSGWKHFLASWDLAAGATHLYLNDVSDKNILTGPTNNTIDYTRTQHRIGARSGGSNKIDADVADLWFSPSTYLDLSIEANRRKFISAEGKPVDLGPTGALPTGSPPIVFLSGAVDSWHVNKGTGGGFTENGALTAASTSPSD